jgi:hypothetical protein
MKVRIETPLQVTPETFWTSLFFDEDYNRGLYQALGFQAFEVLELERHADGRIRRLVRAEPPVKAPDFLKRKLAQRLSYLDDGQFDPRTQTWTFTNESNVAKGSTQIGGTIRAEPSPTGSLMIVELELNVSAFGLGGIAERVIEKNARESYRTTADFLHDYAQKRGLLASQSPAGA